MKQLIDTEKKAIPVFLIGFRDQKTAKEESESRIRELAGLAAALDLEILGQEIIHIRENNVQYGMGTGKAAELAEKAAVLGAECLVFDREISPSQQRNWEELSKKFCAGLSVIDRQELIIQIFVGRARTREAVLQSELAELVYSLPRLQHKYIDLNRQRGGRYGTRGSGETRLETDRRQTEHRIHRLEEELEEIRRQRETQRKQRQRRQIPVCAIAGYTNAGKSSLLNALTNAGVHTEDKLFATLDSTARRLELPGGLSVLAVDTVGFIRRLPHTLVKAFHSTLEDVCLSDLLIHVLDASDPDIDNQYETTLGVLRELGANDIPRITVLNKADKWDSQNPQDSQNPKESGDSISPLDNLEMRFPKAIPVSALTGKGLDELLSRMEHILSGAVRHYRLPQSRPDLAALLHRSAAVISEKYQGEHIEIQARVDEKISGKLKEYETV